MIRTEPWPRNLGALHLPSVGTGATAFVDLSTEEPERVTYGAFEERCARLAGGLRTAGITRDDRVGLLGENSAAYAVAFFAIVRMGAVAVPLNIRLPDDTLGYIANDAGLALVLGDDEQLARLPGVPTVALRDASLLRDPLPPAEVEGSEPAVLLYTSGSTGRPKGVVCSHRSQVVSVRAWAGLATSRSMERTLVAAPLYHKNGLGETKIALSIGAEVVLQRRFDARAYLEAAAAYRCTTLSGVPTMFALMLAQDDLLEQLDLSAVRGIEVGSAPFTEALFERVRAAFPAARIFNSYGTTEFPAIFGDHPDDLAPPRTTVGYPLSSVEVRLVDDAMRDANPGELLVRGEGVMDGYLGLPEATAAKFVDGWYRTGDVMRRDEDRWFHFAGRVDDMFVCGGENVFPGAVVQLLESHPLIRQAAVVALPDDVKGAVPVAFVVTEPSSTLDESQVRAWAREHGPAFQHPRRVWFLDALPLSGTEKVDVRALEVEAVRRAAAA
ncbi:MAG: class I adenylate-forming enzyme family protein [Actinomycetota bacterium]